MGGSYGHLSHPYEQSTNLSFKDMKELVSKCLTGNIDRPTEKTDGQALAVSYKNGHLIAARNKGHLKNAGETALTARGVAEKFAGRGSLTTAFASAATDLELAFQILDEERLSEVFDEGRNFMHIEIMHPDSANVINYDHPYIVFHGIMSYDIDGNATGEDNQIAFELARELVGYNEDEERTYDIISPAVLNLPNLTEELPTVEPMLLSLIDELMEEFDLTDEDRINDYYTAFWNRWLDENSPKDVTSTMREVLLSRWAMEDKSRRLREIPEVKSWAKEFEKNELKDVRKDINLKFENVFLKLGSIILTAVDSILVSEPSVARAKMKEDVNIAINDILNNPESSDSAKEKLLFEVRRLQMIGGTQAINSIEGFVFKHNDETFKITGCFAPLNQILGISRYNR